MVDLFNPAGRDIVGSFQRGQLGSQAIRRGTIQEQILRQQLEQQRRAAEEAELIKQKRQAGLDLLFPTAQNENIPVQPTGAANQLGSALATQQPDAFGTLPTPVEPTLDPREEVQLLRARISGVYDPTEIEEISRVAIAQKKDPRIALQQSADEALQDAARALALNDPASRNRIFQERIQRITARGGNPDNTRFIAQLPFDQQTAALEEVLTRGAGSQEAGKAILERQLEKQKAEAQLKLEQSQQAGRLELQEDKFKRERDLKQLELDLSQSENKFEKAQKIRNELQKQPQVQDFNKIESSFGRVTAAVEDPSPAGDLALIFNFMKMLDPGSVVRESEFATAENAAGVPERVRNQYNKILEGIRLTPKQRKDFADRAEKLFSKQRELTERIENDFVELAKDNNLKRSDIIIRGRGAQQQQRVITTPSGRVLEFEVK